MYQINYFNFNFNFILTLIITLTLTLTLTLYLASFTVALLVWIIKCDIGSAGLQTYRTIVLTNAAAAAAAPAMLPNSKHKQS